MEPKKFLVVLPALLLLGACESMPSAPSMLALPGSSKTFDQFHFDDVDCRQYASALLDGGAGAGDTSAYALQRRYDNSYLQCMYAKGHKVPVAGVMTSAPPHSMPPPPPPPSVTPPPPPPATAAPPPPPRSIPQEPPPLANPEAPPEIPGPTPSTPPPEPNFPG